MKKIINKILNCLGYIPKSTLSTTDTVKFVEKVVDLQILQTNRIINTSAHNYTIVDAYKREMLRELITQADKLNLIDWEYTSRPQARHIHDVDELRLTGKVRIVKFN